jgi:hypothetical protein
MNGTNTAIAIMILIFIVTPLLFYMAAQQSKKVFKHKKRKFYALSKNYFQFKEHVTIEADRWPIYARPILFTEIDHEAQIEFAKAQQALSDADQILPQIETIDEPKLNDQFTVQDLFNVFQNLNTIFLRSQLVGHMNALEEKIVNLGSSLRSLRRNRQQVEKRRLEVEKSIQELKIRTEQIHRRLKPLDIWKSIEANNISWVVTSADRCELEASNSATNLSDLDQGYIEYATADIFVNIGNFSLDCIELFLESQAISRRYKLDQFFKLFNESTGFLQTILEMDEVWSGWKKLKGVKPYIDQLPMTRQEAEKSLRSFKNRQKHLEWLILLTSQIDVESEIEDAEALEKECTDYWYSYAEQSTYWEKALGNPPRFPVTELNHFQTLLFTEINPQIDIDMIIKQSQILGLMKKIGLALESHSSIENLILRLERELDAHKDAQEFVNQLLDSEGEATLIFKELKLALVDTSPNISERGTRLENAHQTYSVRAKRIKGADFPELLKSLEQFIVDTDKLVRAHLLQMVQLKAEYDRFYEEIYSLNKELVIYIEHIPKFDIQSIKLFNSAFEESLEILDEPKIESYSWLRPTTNKMQAWIEKNDFFIAQARDKYEAFETGKRRVEKLLEQTQEEIDIQRVRIEPKWGWYRSEILPRINAIARYFNREKKDWERLVERNWAEYNITRAISECENLIQFCEGKLIELTQAIEKVNHKENQLRSKVEAVSLLLKRNGAKLSSQDQHHIKSPSVTIIMRQLLLII